MNPLLYFFPAAGRQTITAADFERCGVGYAVSAHGVTARGTVNAPGDQAGFIACGDSRAAAGDLLYKPLEQTWRRIAGTELWCGYWNGRKPGASDLGRARVYDGQAVRLLDGGDWIVPRCYAFFPETRPVTLPLQLDLNDEGIVIARPHERYRNLCEAAMRFYEQFTHQLPAEQRMTTMQRIDLAVEALAVNYHVGRTEIIGLLGLWGTDEFGLVLRALVDGDEIEAWAARQVEGESANPT